MFESMFSLDDCHDHRYVQIYANNHMGKALNKLGQSEPITAFSTLESSNEGGTQQFV